jgi:hypothetical protein
VHCAATPAAAAADQIQSASLQLERLRNSEAMRWAQFPCAARTLTAGCADSSSTR